MVLALSPPDPELVTARAVIERCETYRHIVERYVDDYPSTDPDIVIAVMAQESACDPNAVGGESIGLMQITPRPWTLEEHYLYQPVWNIWQGMWFLESVYNSDRNDGTWRTALAAYNCGWTSLEADKCLYFGGYTYAERVLEFWLPLIRDMRAEAVGEGEQLVPVLRWHNGRAYYQQGYASQEQAGQADRGERVSSHLYSQGLPGPQQY